jgi:TolB protein
MAHLRLTVIAAGVVAASAASLGGTPAGGAFPGENGRIAFVSDRDGNADVYTMLSDGTHVRRLTHLRTGADTPRFSARGHRIVFVTYPGGTGEIWVMNADGSHQRRVTRNRDTRSAGDFDPAFSRSGKTIVFASDRKVSGQSDIWTIHSDGTHLRRLTHTFARNESGPVFSPDDRSIVFSGETGPNSAHDEIYRMRTDGSHRRRLTHEGRVRGEHAVHPDGANALSPDLSPHGAIAVFSRESGFAEDAQLYRVDSDGRHERLLTRGPGSSAAPAFAPDGRWIAFDNERDGDGEIFVMGLNGHQLRQLTHNRAFDSDPDWQPLADDD